MPRSMKDANRYIFSALKDFIDDHPKFDRTVDYFGENYIRFIQTNDQNDQEKEWLKKLRIITYKRLTSVLKFAIFEFDSKFYFISVSLNEQNIDLSSLEEYGLLDFDNNSGIFTALIYGLKVGVKEDVDPYKILDEVFYEIEENKKEGFEYIKIVDFFESIKIYQITKNCPFVSDNLEFTEKDIYEILLFRLALLLLVKNDAVRILKFSPETLECFIKLCEEGSMKISYENLLYSFVSFSWKHCFLDIYRCLEKLFSIPKLKNFYDTILEKKDLLNFQDFATLCEEEISLKLREEETLEKLLNGEEKITNRLGIRENSYKFIYKLRNSIVHFRASQETMVPNDDDDRWNIIINVCLRLVFSLYRKYEDYL
jgi:hypothetical protein